MPHSAIWSELDRYRPDKPQQMPAHPSTVSQLSQQKWKVHLIRNRPGSNNKQSSWLTSTPRKSCRHKCHAKCSRQLTMNFDSLALRQTVRLAWPCPNSSSRIRGLRRRCLIYHGVLWRNAFNRTWLHWCKPCGSFASCKHKTGMGPSRLQLLSKMQMTLRGPIGFIWHIENPKEISSVPVFNCVTTMKGSRFGKICPNWGTNIRWVIRGTQALACKEALHP